MNFCERREIIRSNGRTLLRGVQGDAIRSLEGSAALYFTL